MTIQIYIFSVIASNFYSSGGITSYQYPSAAAVGGIAGADTSSGIGGSVSKGPRFTSLPPSRLNFLNTVGATLDCVASSFTPITVSYNIKYTYYNFEKSIIYFAVL